MPNPTSSVNANGKLTQGITKAWLLAHGFSASAIEKGVKRSLQHRWLEDYEKSDLRGLDEKSLTWLRIYVLESVYNTFSSNPEWQLHRDFVKDGKTVGAKRMEGYGIYQAYNKAEYDLLTKLKFPTQKLFFGYLVSAEAWAEDMAETDSPEVCTDDVYPPDDDDPEQTLIDMIDAKAGLAAQGQTLDTDPAGTQPRRVVAVIKSQGKSLRVEGMTYLNFKGILVKDVKAVDGSRLWPDDREVATRALHQKREQMRKSSKSRSNPPKE